MSYSTTRLRIRGGLADLALCATRELDPDIYARTIAALERLREVERLVAQLEGRHRRTTGARVTAVTLSWGELEP